MLSEQKARRWWWIESKRQARGKVRRYDVRQAPGWFEQIDVCSCCSRLRQTNRNSEHVEQNTRHV